MSIPGTKVVFDDAAIEAIAVDIGAILRSGQLSNGRYVQRFEETFRREVAPGAAHVVAVNSGTGALEVVLRALGLEGGLIVCPSNTYAATAWAILASGNTPLFVGWDRELQPSLHDIERALRGPHRRDVTAVVVTHVGGIISGDVIELSRMCREAGVPLIEDAAHAHGASLGGRGAGCFGDAAAFSLFATKVVTSAEGGVAVFRDAEPADVARVLRDQGKQPGTGNVHVRRGYNWRMSEAHAIIGHHHALTFVQRHRSRARAAARYQALLADVAGLETIAVGADRVPSHYKHIVFSDDDLSGVPQGGRVYEAPLHTQPVLAGSGRDGVEEMHPNLGRHRCLPLFDHMQDGEVDEVVAALRAHTAARTSGEAPALASRR